MNLLESNELFVEEINKNSNLFLVKIQNHTKQKGKLIIGCTINGTNAQSLTLLHYDFTLEEGNGFIR